MARDVSALTSTHASDVAFPAVALSVGWLGAGWLASEGVLIRSLGNFRSRVLALLSLLRNVYPVQVLGSHRPATLASKNGKGRIFRCSDRGLLSSGCIAVRSAFLFTDLFLFLGQADLGMCVILNSD
jgi:hypothetical protein